MKNTHALQRSFLPADFVVTNWEYLAPFFEKLISYEINDIETLEQLIFNRAELEAVIDEAFAWAYINMNCDTEDREAHEKFMDFVEKIQPYIVLYSDKLNKKIVQNKFFDLLPDDLYFTYKRSLKSSIEIFREANVPLFIDIEKQSQEFGVISGAMVIDWEGEELTMPAAAMKLKDLDRDTRLNVYKRIVNRRSQDRKLLDDLMTELVQKRDKVGKNADFKNFRDYAFKAMGRFDYTPEDCKAFHKTVSKVVTPLIKKIHQHRAKCLGLEVLKPWDLSVDISGKPALKPFSSSNDLLEKTKQCFGRLDPEFKGVLETMEKMQRFDLDSRKGKAPGGFQYPLNESGVPFIFMNATESHQDVETLVHEGGHALHFFASSNVPLISLRSTPHEVSELASMAMELISMEAWDIFYDPVDIARAKQEKLEDVLLTLPGVARGDAFQHWLYENPNHTVESRVEAWKSISAQFETGLVDFSDFSEDDGYRWQQVLHFYEVPFYYIEYGFAQLGAIALWKNFVEDRENGLQGYKNFMKYGYTRTIPELYDLAGIRFDFSENYIRELVDFVEQQLSFS